MDERTCLECGKVVDQVEGRRPRLFCKDTNCKANYHKKKNPPEKGIVVVNNESWKIVALNGKHQITAKTPEAVALLKQHFSLVYNPDGRDNTFQNAARGRDQSGINEDELKSEIKFAKLTKKSFDGAKIKAPIHDEFGQREEIKINPMTLETQALLADDRANGDGIPKQLTKISTIPVSEFNSAIEEQIKAIRAEKCPDHRNTSLGKKVWEKEQRDKITELSQQLK